MITRRPAFERGHSKLDWLDSWHTFSFSDYYDPEHMAFRSLRVINDDIIAGGGGFGTHPHQDMEIVTYVLDGALQHRDSLGTGSIIKPGDSQRMSAGTGIFHSEFNASKTEPVRLLQIWIEPSRRGIKPSYEQKRFPLADQVNQLHLIGSPDGRGGSVTIIQDVLISAGRLSTGSKAIYPIDSGRHAWLQVARGDLTVSGIKLQQGDGLAVSGEPKLDVTASTDAELLIFDLA